MSAAQETVAAVVVTYNPGVEALEPGWRTLARQVARVYVVDNSDQPDLARRVDQIASRIDGVQYVANHGNQGIAHALNRGAELAVAEGASWLLTLDDDSVLGDHHVARILEFIARQSRPSEVAIVGTPYRGEGGVIAQTPAGGEAKALITSGNLVRLSALAAAGGYREEFFIDYVDFDLCFRLRRAGHRVLECHDVMFEHKVGVPQRGSLLGRKVYHPHYSPLRSYYMSRNRLVFARENLRFDPGFVAGTLRDIVRDAIKILLGEPDKGRKLAAIANGIRDGMRMRLGKHPTGF